jgi:hypothetical protein
LDRERQDRKILGANEIPIFLETRPSFSNWEWVIPRKFGLTSSNDASVRELRHGFEIAPGNFKRAGQVADLLPGQNHDQSFAGLKKIQFTHIT